MGKISVVVPIYKVENYLDRCIRSLVNQSYKDMEIILVDDGSPDSCPEKCDEWEKKDDRIKVIHKVNGGLSDARNKGIEMATGEYIAFVDSDDFIDLDMYSTMIETMERTNSEISTCGRYLYDNQTHQKSVAHICSNEMIFSPSEAIGELLCGGVIEEATWDKVYKRFLFNEIKFPVGEINEDITTIPKVFEKANRIVCVNKAFYNYCYNPTSITHSSFSKEKLVVKKHIEEMSDYVLHKYPQLFREVAVFRGRYSASQLYSFYNQPELKKQYKIYYKYYLKNIRSNYIETITATSIPIKKKIEITMMAIGVYGMYRVLKRHI